MVSSHGSPEMPEPSFPQRLKDRKIVQWGLAYLCGAWVLVEATSLVVEQFSWPAVAGQVVTILSLFGFFVVLVVAWYHGEKGRQRVSGPELLIIALLLLISGGVLSTFSGSEGPDDPSAETNRVRHERSENPSIAVLPLDNISPDPGDAHYSEGMHDEIISQLQKISALTVISRTSVMQYREGNKTIPEIAAELGVDFVLEGSVRKEGDRIRLTAQLIDAEHDEHLWANSYNRQLTVGGLFEIQADVAQRIAAALEAELTPEEEAQIDTRLTDDLEAYEAYLRPQPVDFSGYDERDFRYAVRMYSRATELDPEFGVAFARLSRAHGDLYWFAFDATQSRADASREALERAMELAPEHPEVHIAAGYYQYHMRGDYEAALREFNAALSVQPNHPQAIAGVGYIYRRMGRFEEAAEFIKRAFEVDPLATRIAFNLGETYFLMRSYQEAERYLKRAVSVLPEYGRPYAYWALVRILAAGDVDGAREILEDGILAGARPDGEAFIPYVWTLIDILGGQPEKALERIDEEGWELIQNQFFFLPVELLRGELLELTGDHGASHAALEAARSTLEAEMEKNPDDHRLHGAMSLTLAGLGRSEEAIRSAELGAELMSLEIDSYKAVFRLEDLARVCAAGGEEDRALDIFGDLLDRPGVLTTHLLELDPRLANLRNHPRFQALLNDH
jgi:TolB-like protein/Flp pilus assembly protein TadD